MLRRAPIPCALLLAVAAMTASGAPDAAIPEREWVHATLDNGLELSILADPAMELVATETWVHVGTADESAGERGLAHLFEHLMFGPTATDDARAYWRLHHRHGGYSNAYTSPDETVYVSRIPPEGHDEVLRMEAERLRSIVLDDERLANERRIVLEELRMRTENNPIIRAAIEAQAAVLGDHPYAYRPEATMTDVAATTLDEARSFFDRHYRPERIHLVIAGPVDPERTTARVRELFGSLEPGPGAGTGDLPPLVGRDYPASTVLEEDIPPVEVAAFGFPLPPADAPDRLAVDVMVELLAGSAVDPVRERLVKERGKAVEAGAEALQLRRGGAVAFYSAQLPYRRRSTAFRLLDETRDELARLEWLTDDALLGAKRALERQELEKRYLAGEIASSVGHARWWEGDAGAALDRAERIAEVDREAVAVAFDRYIGGAEPIRLYAKPERVPWYVRAFGWLAPLFV